MPERKWTEAQLDAIHRNGKNILVSAAAGSGKTAVLTKRIIEKLTDKENPADISRMLIVTFTKAAANELKERIAKAVSEAIAKNPYDKRLKHQYILLQNAKISTIHGFCFDLIKKNFEQIGLSPSVSVSDQTQSSLMMEQVADLVIDNYYSSVPGYHDIENFAEFADNFISLKDNKLSEMLISVYEKVASFPRGIEFLADSAYQLEKVIEEGIYSSVWGKQITAHLCDVFGYYNKIFSDACDFFQNDDIYADKYYPSFEYEYRYAASLFEAARSHDIEKVKKVLESRSPVPLKPLKKEYQTDDCLFYRNARTEFGNKLTKICELFFSQNDETVRKTAVKTHDFVRKLYLFLKSFEKLYSAEKRKRDLLDFNDLERTAYKLLVDESGKPTKAAISVSHDFDEIYIDEYQDVNKLQDMIFTAISTASSRFMVGDIKQSIYGFRGAEPALFAAYRLDNRIDKIYLSHNFRCDKPIIDFVNLVCGSLFTSAGKTVPYDSSDELICGKQGSGDDKVEIHIVASEKGKSAERRTVEAEFVAERISSLISEGYSPRDICILLRSASRSAAIYEDALKKLNIPCQNQVSKDLFVNPEVLLVMNILNVIDNPSRDIYLAGTLKSPIFNFTLSELVTIRNYAKEGSLFFALKQYTADYHFEKGKYFLEKLEQYRKLSFEPVDKLIWAIYCDTHIFAMATGTDEKNSFSDKKANLLMLYDYARKFESGSFKGLYNFIRYINDVLESGAGFDSASASSEAEQAVRVMTIHQSKGLEYPVVFLCDCAASFSNADTQEKVLIDKDFGTAMKLSDDTGLATYDTLMRRAEALGISEKNCEEEIRVLYVALTRAVNKLIITASDNDPEKLVEDCRHLSRYSDCANGYVYQIRDNFISWILISSIGKYLPNIVRILSADETKSESMEDKTTGNTQSIPENKEVACCEEEIKKLEDEFRNRFNFRYPGNGYLIPAKLSVSELYPEVLDEYDDSVKYSSKRKEKMKKPSFMLESDTDAADRGTATHQFMQFCDFALLEKYGVDHEIKRLIDYGFLDAFTSELIEKEAINRFLSSDIFFSLRDAEFIKREIRFNAKLPASIFTSEPEMKESLKNETVLVQGIMDCVFTDTREKLTILDYKTDRIPYELRTDPKAAEEYLINKHINQLSYYLLACEKLMCRPADRVVLYSFSLAKAIDIPPKRFIL